MTRILVTVSRSYREMSTMRGVLERAYAEHPDAVLVHGDNPRGDRDAAGIWRGLGGQVEAWPADWEHCGPDCRHTPPRTSTGRSYCPYAGYRRNTAMVESSPDLLLAFINRSSKGATHCAQSAEDAGIPTLYYRQGEAA